MGKMLVERSIEPKEVNDARLHLGHLTVELRGTVSWQ